MESLKMLLRIDHNTTYSYEKEVVLAPHIIRLYPKTDCTQKTRFFSLQTDPEETGRSINSDLDGNTTVTLWFSGKYERLTMQTQCVVETLRGNPFDFIISDVKFLNLPMKYPDMLRPTLAPYLVVDPQTCREVSELRESVLAETDAKTLDFLLALCERIRRGFTYLIRENGDPWPVERTLEEKKGSCRDLVALFISVCRSTGLACRHVSGYTFNEDQDFAHNLHAWAEVYVPGGGWRGYDPSAGLAVANHHVTLATGAEHELISPVSGSFYADRVATRLEFSVNISEDAYRLE